MNPREAISAQSAEHAEIADGTAFISDMLFCVHCSFWMRRGY